MCRPTNRLNQSAVNGYVLVVDDCLNGCNHPAVVSSVLAEWGVNQNWIIWQLNKLQPLINRKPIWICRHKQLLKILTNSPGWCTKSLFTPCKVLHLQQSLNCTNIAVNGVHSELPEGNLPSIFSFQKTWSFYLTLSKCVCWFSTLVWGRFFLLVKTFNIFILVLAKQ